MDKTLPSSLYVHIPFCESICGYCDFTKLYYRPDWADSYLLALFSEISRLHLAPKSLHTIYVGGGTPSCLNLDQTEALFAFLSPYLKEGGEFSCEANPESCQEEKVAIWKKHGVNRVSLGVQSSHPSFLSLMGRSHRFEDAKSAVSLLKKAGITNMNCDLIYALPGETLEELKEDIEAFCSLQIPHLSAYSLILEDATIFSFKGIQEASQDVQGEMLEFVVEALKRHGYRHYEVSNFAIPGHECRHNLVYWKDEPYYGVGLGASGYVGPLRYTNTKSLSLYIKGAKAGRIERKEETVSLHDDLLYFLLCNLRLAEGFDQKDFELRFGKTFESACPGYEKCLKSGLLVQEGGRFHCSERGICLLDSVLLELIP